MGFECTKELYATPFIVIVFLIIITNFRNKQGFKKTMFFLI